MAGSHLGGVESGMLVFIRGRVGFRKHASDCSGTALGRSWRGQSIMISPKDIEEFLCDLETRRAIGGHNTNI